MPRCTRKELILEDEEQARRNREEGYRRLGVELRQLRREGEQSGTYCDGKLTIVIGIL